MPHPLPVAGGSGKVLTLEGDFTGFDRLDVSHAFRVEVRQGDGYHVTVRIDDSLEEHLLLDRQGDTLRIGLEPGHTYNLGAATLGATVQMPELAGLELSGASRATLQGFQSTRPLYVHVSGASQLRGEIEAGAGQFKASGTSQIRLVGSGRDVAIDASGASQLDLSHFEVDDAEIEASGASTVSIRAGGRLDARASGASRVRYRGEPSIGRIHTSGASSVDRG
jgi:hypothetical protein